MATVNILGLNTIGDIQMVYVDNNPETPTNSLLLPDGSEFPQGSMAYANISGVGVSFIKAAAAGGGLTGWKQIDASQNDWSLAGNALGGGEILGSTNAQDVSMVYNSLLRMKLKTDGVHFGSVAGHATLTAIARAVQTDSSSNLFALDYDKGDGDNRPYVIERGNVKQIVSVATPVTDTILSFTPPTADCIMLLEYNILARSMAGGTAGEAFSYKRVVTARNVGGTVTIRQTASLVTSEDSAAPQHDVAFDVNTGVIRARGSQQSGKTLNWHTRLTAQIYDGTAP